MKDKIKTITVRCDLCGADDFDLITRSKDYEYWTSKKFFKIVRCNQCGLIYINPRPESSEIKKIYPPEYTPHKFTKSKQLAVRIRRWRERKKISRSYFTYIQSQKANILDFGCGDGGLIKEIIRLAPKSWKVVGMDIDQEAVNSARANGLPVYNLKEFRKLLKKNGLKFDLVIANQVIEHVESPKKMIKDIHQYLIPGGSLILETPNFQSWDRIIFSSTWDGYHIPRHWNIFEPATIKKLLRENGYADIQFEWLLSPNIWVKSIKNYLKKQIGLSYNIIHKYNPILLAFFSLVDLTQIKISHGTSNMRVITQSERISKK